MSKHTPTPWIVAHWKGSDKYAIQPKDVKECQKNGSVVPFALNEANARHIVKCVNLHDDLVEALRQLTEDVEDERITQASINKAKKAIQKAESLANRIIRL